MAETIEYTIIGIVYGELSMHTDVTVRVLDTITTVEIPIWVTDPDEITAAIVAALPKQIAEYRLRRQRQGLAERLINTTGTVTIP